MNNINYKLREAYNTLLTPVLSYKGQPVPVYNEGVKMGELPELYVYLSGVRTSENNSPKQMSRIETVINMTIVSKSLHNSNPEAIDQVAQQFYATIYPERQSLLTIDGAHILDNTVSNDVVNNLGNNGQQQFLVRTITINHIIFLS